MRVGTSGTRYIAIARGPELTISFSDGGGRVVEKRRTAAIEKPNGQWSPKLIIRRAKKTLPENVRTELKKTGRNRIVYAARWQTAKKNKNVL